MTAQALDLGVAGLSLLCGAAWWSAVRVRPEAVTRVTWLVALLALAAGVALGVFGTGDLFAAFRAACWVLFVDWPVLALAAAVRLGPVRRVDAAAFVGGALFLALVGAYAFFVEPRRLEVVHLEVRSAEVAAPLRIGVLTDLQTDRIGPYEEAAFRRLVAERPDLILLAGDFLQVGDAASYVEQVRAFRALLPLLQAPLGVFAVRGNVERPTWADDLFAGTHVRALPSTATVALGPLTLTGLDLWPSFDPRLVVPPAAGFHVAFGHAPDYARSAAVGADLLVAGHTHGGQVQIPFVGPPLTLSTVPMRWAAGGLAALPGGRHLVVSRGVGMERGRAPRLRFWCRPQLVIVEVVPSQQ